MYKLRAIKQSETQSHPTTSCNQISRAGKALVLFIQVYKEMNHIRLLSQVTMPRTYLLLAAVSSTN